MEDNLLPEHPEYKLYQERAIALGTFFGGPLAAGYLISENFKALGEPDRVKPTWLIAIGVTALTFGSVYLIPILNKIPNIVFPVLYILIVQYVVKKYQSDRIKTHLENGGQTWSTWRAVGIGFLGMLILVGLIVAIVLLFNREAFD